MRSAIRLFPILLENAICVVILCILNRSLYRKTKNNLLSLKKKKKNITRTLTADNKYLDDELTFVSCYILDIDFYIEIIL